MDSKPIIFEFGTGRIGVKNFTQKDDSEKTLAAGLILNRESEPHPIGSSFGNPGIRVSEPFVAGETVLLFQNVESVNVVIEELEIVRGFLAQ